MGLSEWSEKQLLLLTVGIIGVFVVGLGICLFLSYRSLQEVEGEIANLRAQKRKADATIRREPEVRKKLAEKEAKAAKLLALLPDEAAISPLFKQVSRAARGLDNVSGDRESKPAGRRKGKQTKGSYSKIIFVLKYEGGFHELAAFVNHIEEGWQGITRFIEVDSLSIKAQDEGLVVENPKHEIGLQLITYVYEKVRGQPKAAAR